MVRATSNIFTFKFLIKLEVPVIRFFTYIGGAWILIGLTGSLLKKRFGRSQVLQ